MPPREPVNPTHSGPFSRGPGAGAGRHSAGPGYAAPGGPRPRASGPSGPSGSAESSGQFDGGYAYVIRASENPVRPANHARPASHARPVDPVPPADDAPADVYVYRDTSGQPDDPAAARGQRPDERGASYWYDLPGTESAPAPEEVRGPFEPLVSSSDSSPGTALPSSPAADRTEPAAPNAVGDDGHDDSVHTQARKLEQIKDFYLTAEAIGDQNVDKHFDQLLAQQRDLISEYFKQSNPAGSRDDLATQTQAEPDKHGEPGPADGQAGPWASESFVAEPPRVW
jgi:hypothetical protein